jgi:hypothetical protein
VGAAGPAAPRPLGGTLGIRVPSGGRHLPGQQPVIPMEPVPA